MVTDNLGDYDFTSSVEPILNEFNEARLIKSTENYRNFRTDTHVVFSRHKVGILRIGNV